MLPRRRPMERGRAATATMNNRFVLLKPLNMYGYSKHLFDCKALESGWLKGIVGLKYFNVFGPNENHKGDMRSVINKAYARIRDEGVIALFNRTGMNIRTENSSVIFFM